MMILKVTKKQGFTLNLKDTVSKRPWGAGGGVLLKFTPSLFLPHPAVLGLKKKDALFVFYKKHSRQEKFL